MKIPENICGFLRKNPKTWLITGVAGFIGSNLLEFLLSNNQIVKGLDNFSSGYKHNIEEVLRNCSDEQISNFQLFEGDICNLKICNDATKGVDYVLHQAAVGSVTLSIEDPILTNQVNVDGFLNILIASKKHNVKNFVYASSSAIYGDSHYLPKVEDRIGKPLSPYALSKIINEMYADIFFKTYRFSSIGLRYFNVFGKRQDPKGYYSAVIPRWINAILDGETIEIYGDGESARDFSYIDNIVQANIIAAINSNKNLKNEVFNIAIGEMMTLNQLFNILKININKMGFEYRLKPSMCNFRKGDIKLSHADINKAKKILNYSPTVHTSEGLIETIKWFADNKIKQ